ncbi:M23 family metallopeptidase [Paraburkholderia sp. 2C]
MDLVDTYELAHGIYPISFDRRWHCGVHLMPSMQNEAIHAIADGAVVAYRVCQHAYDGGSGHHDSCAGFVLLRHTTETGDGRMLIFYSLYMHLLDLASYQSVGADAKLLPEFLRMPAAGDDSAVPTAQSGDGLNVYRKDVLGWTGGCQGQRHLHFEIFMTKGDFDAYFGKTQLGRTELSSATGNDCWGHSYYKIPKDSWFRALPRDADDHGKLSSIAFDRLQTGQNALPLVVEMYFHKGSKYTNVWSVANDGSRTLLTSPPICEVDYEYDMYKRADKLYPDCPSDGYELLRFGRILSTPVALTSASGSTPPSFDPAIEGNPKPTKRSSQRTTWMRIAFDKGSEGYIDVNDPAVLKLSDADFPHFTGWQKISEGNSPFNADGLCDIDALKKIVKDTADHQTPNDVALKKEHEKEDVLARYVKSNDAVRQQLRGFICEAPTEWDSTHNEERYQKLKNEGEFYCGNEAGYVEFIKLLTSFQFWEKTGLPAGQKLWFFHALAFIRHFRKCGWLSSDEFKQIYHDKWYGNNQQEKAQSVRNLYLKPLNFSLRKFGMLTAIRQAHFLGQGAVESTWLQLMQERSMLGNLDAKGMHGQKENPASTISESDLGHWYGELRSEDDAWFRSVKFSSRGARIAGSYDWINGNCDQIDAQKFRGRGFKQLTGRSNYAKYWVFRGWLSKAEFSENWWTDPAFIAHNVNGMIKRPAQIDDPHRIALAENCIDSAGFYLRFERPKVVREIDKDDDVPLSASSMASTAQQKISRQVTQAINGGLTDADNRFNYTRIAKKVLI